MTDCKALWRQVLDLYEPTSLPFRLKFLIRWNHGNPFERLEAHIPRAGRVIDIGCGNGFLANLLALASHERQVLGLDIDDRHVRCARQTIGQRRNIEFAVRNLFQEDLPTADAVILVDTLHHMTFEQQDHVLKLCARSLGDRGVLFILDVDVRPRWKYCYNVLFDSLTGLFNITQGSALSYQGTAAMTARLQRMGFTNVEVLPFARHDLAARVLYIARK